MALHMNKGLLQFVFISLLPLGVCQCSSAYRLVEYKEYCDEDDLDTWTTYQYENGVLYSKTEVLTRMKDVVDSTVTYYDVIKGNNSIDSIETSYRYVNGVPEDTTKIVKTFNPDGIIRKETYSEYKDGDWKELSYTLYDSKGRWRDAVWHNFYHSWSTYDSLDSQIGFRYTLSYPNTPIYVDTVELASDGLTAMKTQYYFWEKDERQHVMSRTRYKLDDKGRVILQEKLDTDQDSIQPKVLYWDVFRYDRKGRIKTETQFSSFDSNPNKKYRSFKYR